MRGSEDSDAEPAAPNPYAAPQARFEASPGARLDEGGYEARYELTEADGGTIVAARESKVLTVAGILIVLVAVGTKSFGLVLAGIILVALQPFRRVTAERSVAALRPGQRRAVARIHDSGIAIRDEEGNVTRLSWSDVSAKATPTHICFYQGAVAFVVPARGFANGDAFHAAAQLAVLRATGRKLIRMVPWAMAMWVVLIMIFVAIWSFFGAAPPQAPPAAVPSASAT